MSTIEHFYTVDLSDVSPKNYKSRSIGRFTINVAAQRTLATLFNRGQSYPMSLIENDLESLYYERFNYNLDLSEQEFVDRLTAYDRR